MPCVLVTGAAGFLGSHVAAHCVRLGFDVVGVDDLSGGFVENVPAGITFRRGTITDPGWMQSVFEEGNFEFVYHLAAYAAEGLSHHIRRFNYEMNIVGSMNVINQSVLHHIKCFVFTSSIAVYGAAQTPMAEDILPRPEDPYGISKYAVELDLAAANRVFGLPYIVFRPHNVYGEHQNITDPYRNVIGIFMNQVMSNQPMTIFGDGNQTRAFSHVDDVAPIIARAPLVPAAYQQIFNVGADEPHTVLSLARAVADAFGVAPRIQHLPPRTEVVHAYSSHDKVRGLFNPPAPIALPVGLRRMAAWARRRGTAPPVRFDAIEIPLKLPPSWATRAQ